MSKRTCELLSTTKIANLQKGAKDVCIWRLVTVLPTVPTQAVQYVGPTPGLLICVLSRARQYLELQYTSHVSIRVHYVTTNLHIYWDNYLIIYLS